MFKRKCENCNMKSYSASEAGEWICPNCDKDLNKNKAKKEGDNNRILI